MTEAHPEIIIVKRHSAHEEEHHGGAWKIAFADFMTAMMAFFLVLWIISATDKNTKTLIARYFNPVKVEEPQRRRKASTAFRTRTPSTRQARRLLRRAPRSPLRIAAKALGKRPTKTLRVRRSETSKPTRQHRYPCRRRTRRNPIRRCLSRTC